MQTKKKVKEYIDQINQQITENKKQEISQIRDFRQYVKLIGNELQQQQLQEFVSFKKEQKTLITTFLTREKDRKLFENLNKRLTAIEFEHIKKQKKEEVDFSKNLTAQMVMLNRVNIQTMRKKDIQKKQQVMATTVRQHSLDVKSPTTRYGISLKKEAMGNTGVSIRQNMSQQISPRDNIKKLKIMDINDNFQNQQLQPSFDKASAKARFLSMGGQHPQYMDGAAGVYQANSKPAAFHSARQSGTDAKFGSLIRQYQKNHDLTDSKGKLQSLKEFMIFDESVQLPAFPKKITRNAFERSYMKRIINVKMNEFSPVASKN